MKHEGKEIRFDRITARTYDVFHGTDLIGLAVETPQEAKFYPRPEWKYPKVYKAATKTLAVGAFLLDPHKEN